MKLTEEQKSIRLVVDNLGRIQGRVSDGGNFGHANWEFGWENSDHTYLVLGIGKIVPLSQSRKFLNLDELSYHGVLEETLESLPMFDFPKK